MANPTPDNRNLDAALADLRQAAIDSTKPESEVLSIILNARSQILATAPATPEPTTPEARVKAIHAAVQAAGGDHRLALMYVNTKKSLATIKAELLPILAMSRRFGRVA